MKRLLFVTQDKRYWDQISMRRSDPRFFLMPADDIRSARLLLESTRVDLIFVDIGGPNLDGYSLIGSVLAAHTRSTPLIALSKAHNGAPSLTSGMGVMVASRGDLSLRDCQATLQTYESLLTNHEPHGNGVQDLVELAGLEGRSLAIGLRTRGRDGWVFIEQGLVVDASNGFACDPALLDQLDDWPEILVKVAPFSHTALNAARETLALPPVIVETGIFVADSLDEAEEGEPDQPRSPESEPDIEPGAPTAPSVPERLFDAAPLAQVLAQMPAQESALGAMDLVAVNEIIAAFETEVASFAAGILVNGAGEILALAGHLSEADRGGLTGAVHLVFAGGRRILTNLSVEEFQCLTLEAENGLIACWPAGEGLLAVIAGDPRSLGKIRIVAKRILPDLIQYLDAAHPR